jgi:hypothetical protein
MLGGEALLPFQFDGQRALDKNVHEILAGRLALILRNQGSFCDGRNALEFSSRINARW